MSDWMRELHRTARRAGGGLRPRAESSHGIARRRPPSVRAVPLECESVSTFRSARVRRYAVMTVALIVVALAIRFVFLAPIPRM